MEVVARGQITIVAVKDGASTYTKQVYMTSFTRPLKPSGASPNGWSESVPTAYKFENAMDSSHNGYRVAKGNLANDFIKERLSFVVSSATSVNIEIEASSESGYDFIAVGDVDTSLCLAQPLAASVVDGRRGGVAIIGMDACDACEHGADVGR